MQIPNEKESKKYFFWKTPDDQWPVVAINKSEQTSFI